MRNERGRTSSLSRSDRIWEQGGDDFIEEWWFGSRNQSLTMRASEGVICTSPRTADDAVSYGGVPRRKFHVFSMLNAPTDASVG